jgi:hypothetical protein
MKYLLSFSCFGTGLQIDSHRLIFSLRKMPAAAAVAAVSDRVICEPSLLKEPRYELNLAGRKVVLATVREVCDDRCWTLLAAHVRTTDVHLVADVNSAAGRAITDLKAQSTRRLKESGIDRFRVHRWARGGSRIRLRDERAVRQAVRFVIENQGSPMSWYLNPDWLKVL